MYIQVFYLCIIILSILLTILDFEDLMIDISEGEYFCRSQRLVLGKVRAISDSYLNFSILDEVLNRIFG